MNVFQEFKNRGMLAQATDEAAIEKLLSEKRVTFYIGFDPTADSLHIGHFMQMKVMAHMQQAGHRPIAIFGGGTAMVGDPTGKTDMRKMLTVEDINHNIECFKTQMSKFIDISDGKALFINNADWLMNLNYVEFLRDVGVHFTVNRMLAAECFKSRMEKGLSFLEFNYMLMQGYDFYRLYKDHGCVLQMGGDDQWSNIIAGVELIRRKDAAEAYGLTFGLLTTSEGKKMGKTEKGALWLNADKTSPYEFFQYWRNTADADVIKCMNWLTFLPVEEIKKYEGLEGSELNAVKEKLAWEVTALIHGKDEADKALDAARALFSAGGSIENIPTTELADEDFTDSAAGVLDLIVKGLLAPSKAEARRLVQQGGVTVNDEKLSDPALTLKKEFFAEGVIIKKGKKGYHRFVLK
ncbi:MAG: tyrosine--tRNA ligase [Eubacteriales bacterium]